MMQRGNLRKALGLVVLVGMLLAFRPARQTWRPKQGATPPEDQIAQLLLLAWDGTFPEDEQAPLWKALRTHAFGGVVLMPPRGQMLSREDVARFVARAQKLTLLHEKDVARSRAAPFTFRPLFIAVHQPGNAAPDDALAFPQPLPSYMAVAATWNPEHAYRMGFLLGQALRVWGVNMLFGPSLNVADPAQYGQPGGCGPCGQPGHQGDERQAVEYDCGVDPE